MAVGENVGRRRKWLPEPRRTRSVFLSAKTQLRHELSTGKREMVMIRVRGRLTSYPFAVNSFITAEAVELL